MRRTVIEIDQERLDRAQDILGTSGIKDTVNRALDEVVRADLRRRLGERIRTGRGIDRGEEILEASRRWQQCPPTWPIPAPGTARPISR